MSITQFEPNVNICQCCGRVVESGEEKIYREYHGFTYGPGEEFPICPVCGGSLKSAKRCISCGEICDPYDLQDGICEECLGGAEDG